MNNNYLELAKKSMLYAIDIPNKIGARNTIFFGLCGAAFVCR